MSAQFVAASSQYFSLATPPVTATPYTIAMWFMADALPGTSQTLWALNSNTNTDNNKGYISAANLVGFYDGANVATATTASLGTWYFGLWRGITSSSKRLSVLGADGSVNHASIALSEVLYNATFTLGGADLGAGFVQGLTGKIAEYWITGTDIQADGAQTQDALLWRLAYGGPFSVPHIAKDIIEYRSLRSSLAANNEKGDEVYWGGGGRRAWVNNGTALLGPHPPLPYWFARPRLTPQIRLRASLWVPPPKPLTRRRALYLR